MERNVIVFGINNNNTLGLIRSLGKKGIPVVVFLEPCDLYFCALRFSRYIMKMHFLQETEGALELLRTRYSKGRQKTVILTGSDKAAALLDAHYDELRDSFVFFNAGKQSRISYFLDKINTFPLAAECGIDLIPTWHIADGAAIPDDIAYPCITKGNNSTRSSKSDMVVCKNRRALENAIRSGVDYIVQKFIPKQYELDAVGMSYDHGRKVLLPGVVYKVREFLDRQSLFVRLDRLSEYPDFPVEAIKKFIGRIGYEGIFSVEMMYADGKYYFLEINFRNDAMAYIYSYAGVNYPCLWTQYAMGKRPYELELVEKMRSPVYMMQEADLYTMLEGRFSFWVWIRDFYRTDVFHVFDMVDIKPFLYIMGVHVLQVLKRPLRKMGFKV